MSENQSKVFFIRTKLKNDYCYDGIKQAGYPICIPYKDFNMLLRLMREAWYRLNLPFRKIWYNTQRIDNIDEDIIIICDPLITSDFVDYIRCKYPDKRVILLYENRADRTISPDSIIAANIEKWSYDTSDCKKYGMKLMHGAYYDTYHIDHDVIEYDVLYLGRDKGRAEQLFEIRDTFNGLGLKTYFYICADRMHLRFMKKFYQPVMGYQEYLKLLAKTRAILNIVQPGQTSITQRDYEVVFHQVKGITNNPGIRNSKLYDPSRYFILGEDPIEQLPEFLSVPFVSISEEALDEYRFRNSIENDL